MRGTPTYLSALGIINALGVGPAEVARNLFSGVTRGLRQRNDLLQEGRTTYVGEVTVPLMPVPAHLSHYESRNLSLIISTVEQMRVDLDSALEKYGPARIGVVMGSSTSGIDRGEEALIELQKTGILPSSFDLRMQELGSVGEGLAAYLGLAGPAYTISTACSSGAHALAAGKRMLDAGIVDVVLAGGADTLCRLTVNGFQSLSALSSGVCNPFSVNRDGINIGEGAAIFLMTKEEGDVVLWGDGASSDGHSMTSPEPSGCGVEVAMRAALADAGCSVSDISYIHLHGTGTEQNDLMESDVVRRVFGEGIAASSSKGQIGHTLGAAGAMGAAHCWLAAHPDNTENLLPPHIWDSEAGDGLLSEELVTTGHSLARDARPMFLSNAFAFGGNNACLVIGRA